MNLTDEVGHRALAYVGAVSRQGYAMTTEEFNAFMALPVREREPSTAMARLAELSRAVVAQMSVLASPPKESILEWLARLHWLREADGRVHITPLGRAVLAHLDEAGLEEELPAELVLDPADELSYARLIGAIAEAGECLLVDGFFELGNFLDVVQRTRVTRVLVRPVGKSGRLEALQQAVEGYRFDRPFEIRSSDDIHDRFIVPEQGPMRLIGTSLNGVGRRLAVTARVSDQTDMAIRAAVEKAWTRATLVAQGSPPDSSETPDSSQTPDSSENGPRDGVDASDPPAAN